MFVGRSREVAKLEKLYNSNSYEMLVLYGRRRVGKTTLIREFVQDKKVIYFVANQESKRDALIRMSQSVLEVFPEASAYIDYFENWDKLFEYIEVQSRKEKFILVIDEYPYLANSDSSFSSILQNHIDYRLKENNIKLILSGSSISFMEEQVLGYDSPLYGRRTAQMKLLPLNYLDSAEFYPSFSNEEVLFTYGIIGGIPLYMELFSRYESIEEATKDLILNEFGYLYGEIDGLLRQELREPSIYNSIILAIATGHTKLNQIATSTGIEGAKCSKYISTLENIHIVKKEYPVGKKTKKNAIYKIQDNLFQFWYRYVLKNTSKIEMGKSAALYESILNDIPNYMGRVFEDICKDYIKNESMNGKLDVDEIGSWWGNDPVLKKQIEVDIIGVSDDVVIFGECKWRNEKFGISIYNDLVRKSHIIEKDKDKVYYLFSKSGFTKPLVEVAKITGNVRLIGIKELFE